MQFTKLVPIVDLKKSSENLNKCFDICQKAKQIKKKVFPAPSLLRIVQSAIH